MTATLQNPKQAGTTACSKLQKDILLFPGLAGTHYRVGNTGVGVWMRGHHFSNQRWKNPKRVSKE